MPTTQPGAASTTRRAKRAPVPQVSATVAKLIAQVQAEAQAATLEALSAKDGILVLQPLEHKSARLHFFGDTATFEDLAGAEVHWSRNRHCPKSWIGSALADRWHPAHFSVYASRFDGSGRKWNTDLGTFITNDFGDLVEVPQC